MKKTHIYAVSVIALSFFVCLSAFLSIFGLYRFRLFELKNECRDTVQYLLDNHSEAENKNIEVYREGSEEKLYFLIARISIDPYSCASPYGTPVTLNSQFPDGTSPLDVVLSGSFADININGEKHLLYCLDRPDTALIVCAALPYDFLTSYHIISACIILFAAAIIILYSVWLARRLENTYYFDTKKLSHRRHALSEPVELSLLFTVKYKEFVSRTGRNIPFSRSMRCAVYADKEKCETFAEEIFRSLGQYGRGDENLTVSSDGGEAFLCIECVYNNNDELFRAVHACAEKYGFSDKSFPTRIIIDMGGVHND